MRVLIIDGYVDEPACLGVPPYMAPYPRYIAGALIEKGVQKEDIIYRTIDRIRTRREPLRFDLYIIIAGMTVPGKYLRASPITLKEINELSHLEGTKIIGGPIRLGFGEEGGSSAKEFSVPGITLAKKDIEAFVYDLMDHKDPASVQHRMRTNSEIGRWAESGTFIITQHPDYPFVLCELETYRGCPRHSHCSFCTEPFYGKPDFREVNDVVREVSALYENGARYFRLGRQPDLFMYRSKKGVPDPGALEELYSGIRKAAPDLKVLHMDNANPVTISKYPDESRKIAEIIVKYHTSGDVAALGMESADPDVISENDLKATPDEVFESIKLLNEAGAARGASGLPELLPGINFVHGLKGETKKTFELNFQFLKKVLDSGLMVRRVNIRQVMTFAGTPMQGHDEAVWKNKELFLRYKEKIRNEIDLPMLRRVIPAGILLKDVRTEIYDKITFGRQLGTYPLLVGIPLKLDTGCSLDILVTGHGHRSITGIPVPVDINRLPVKLLNMLPGMDNKQAAQVMRGRPFKDREDIMERTSIRGEILNLLL
ncbi:MAG: Fe-S oxidoreductase [Candidatus Methanoperedens nitroreducens]|uniref:Fe-S oxidoreductase n=1 Tax=Candidatus Methanoperedens nitratireducens TaxID=1392998 RepID=A0A0P7ZDY3_9EURY|nr:radical SAM protein [Candidatus Methanoperedens sp. BLZ2]KAB2944783.1 MAG: radical SAM protein [Candidatus Methanoperedens sp.]KPQ41716.1 MAG: Fe-S oxidoreductase [Candidatus Methanoperedens sp. BLZ1]MBZ0177072.1 radical SAM protein [Candidatus Methanoperedens nitroreducens]MCX9077503.1 radical SAM protein [Candidatus Methanoperedens sp.]MCX9087020.1 radical SAM protein [Candidatus Methanoperedens sp.]